MVLGSKPGRRQGQPGDLRSPGESRAPEWTCLPNYVTIVSPNSLRTEVSHVERVSERITRSLVDVGPATAAVLAERLGITPGAVRRHLDPMVEAGWLVAGENAPYGPRSQRGRGRPARIYSVTDLGRDRLPKAYEALSVELMRYLRDRIGGTAVKDFAKARLQPQYERFSQALAGKDAAVKPYILAELLSKDGFAATAEASSLPGTQVCQHHCPVAHAATEFPELCDAEAEMFSQVLGTHVQRLATISHGDAVCTTYLPDNSRSAS